MDEDIRIVTCGPEDNPLDDEWEPEEDDIPEDEYGDFSDEPNIRIVLAGDTP